MVQLSRVIVISLISVVSFFANSASIIQCEDASGKRIFTDNKSKCSSGEGKKVGDDSAPKIQELSSKLDGKWIANEERTLESLRKSKGLSHAKFDINTKALFGTSVYEYKSNRWAAYLLAYSSEKKKYQKLEKETINENSLLIRYFYNDSPKVHEKVITFEDDCYFLKIQVPSADFNEYYCRG